MKIRVNGRPFELWESATMRRSIDDNCGAFRFTNSSTIPGQPYPVKVGQLVHIIVGGETKLRGYVDEVSIVSDESQHTITVSGRDTTADIIDSSVPDSAKAIEGPVSLKKLAETVISGLGADPYVNVEIETKDFTEEELQAAGSGDNAMGFLTNFARKRQVYIVSDGLGDLVIYRPGEIRSQTPITRIYNGSRNNVMTSSLKLSNQDRFNKIVCRSADNIGNDDEADYSGDGASREGTALDNAIRNSRYLEIQAEESMDDSETTERAKEEANIRRARSVEYSATVQGFTHNDGTVWDFGQLVNVNDDYANTKGLLLIRSVEFAVDTKRGSRTKIVCATPDAYQVVDEIPQSDFRRVSIGEDIA